MQFKGSIYETNSLFQTTVFAQFCESTIKYEPYTHNILGNKKDSLSPSDFIDENDDKEKEKASKLNVLSQLDLDAAPKASPNDNSKAEKKTKTKTKADVKNKIKAVNDPEKVQVTKKKADDKDSEVETKLEEKLETGPARENIFKQKFIDYCELRKDFDKFVVSTMKRKLTEEQKSLLLTKRNEVLKFPNLGNKQEFPQCKQLLDSLPSQWQQFYV